MNLCVTINLHVKDIFQLVMKIHLYGEIVVQVCHGCSNSYFVYEVSYMIYHATLVSISIQAAFNKMNRIHDIVHCSPGVLSHYTSIRVS